MTKRKKQIYLVITISPFGLKQVTFKLLDKKPDPYHYTKGEGNCMVFELVDWDYSTQFSKAFEDGKVMDEFGDFSIDTNLSSIPKKKKKFMKEVEKLKKENGWI